MKNIKNNNSFVYGIFSHGSSPNVFLTPFSIAFWNCSLSYVIRHLSYISRRCYCLCFSFYIVCYKSPCYMNADESMRTLFMLFTYIYVRYWIIYRELTRINPIIFWILLIELKAFEMADSQTVRSLLSSLFFIRDVLFR